MGNRQFRHVVPLFSQGDKVIVYPRLIFSRIVEIEALGLDIIRSQLLILELGDIFQEPALILY